MIIVIGLSLINAVLLCLVAYKLVHIYQLGGYRNRPFIKWVFDRENGFFTRLIALTLLGFGGMFIVNVVFKNFVDVGYLAHIGFAFYFLLAVFLCRSIFQQKAKIGLKFTARVKRLYMVMFLLIFGLSFFAMWAGSFCPWIQFSFVTGVALILPFCVIMASWVLFPVEAWIRGFYIKRAKKKLFSEQYKNLIRVGVTGSYGKTSCKNILAKMLAKKYTVASSPSSYNTPLGFSLTVNNILDEHEVFVFEMGLRYRRDIKYLAQLFRPMHGVLTGIGTQHIETMRTVENIKNEKAELLRALPTDGIAVLNGESEKCVELFSELELENKFLVSVTDGDNVFASVQDIKMSAEGCEFEMTMGGEVVKCKTKLLGKHNIQNILMCGAMAYKLGVSLGLIAEAVGELEAIPHRLEMVKSGNGIIILDDSYNASEDGIRAALEVLSFFDGKKVVQTPGLVEQGKFGYDANFKIGQMIADIADEVIVVNELNKDALINGLKDAGFENTKIHFVSSLDGAKELYAKLLSKGDVLLISNDLPDNFK